MNLVERTKALGLENSTLGEWVLRIEALEAALRLADALEQQFPLGTAQHYLDGEAAAELRRLHGEVNALQILVVVRNERITALEAALREAREALDSFDPYDSFACLWVQRKDIDLDAVLNKINEVLK